jgi:RimJ/RimL family protein N-acetyltransferase
MSYLFFVASGAQDAPAAPGEEYTVTLWRPSWRHPAPPGKLGAAFWVWAAFHRLRVFGNRDYAVLLIHEGETLAHRSCLFPPYFRFPFMGPNDLQIGDTWTHPDYRGKGLATFALRHLIRVGRNPGRTFWYVVDEENASSIRVVEKTGFRKIGRGEKRRRFGLNLLGAYVIQRPRHNAEEPITSH